MYKRPLASSAVPASLGISGIIYHPKAGALPNSTHQAPGIKTSRTKNYPSLKRLRPQNQVLSIHSRLDGLTLVFLPRHLVRAPRTRKGVEPGKTEAHDG